MPSIVLDADAFIEDYPNMSPPDLRRKYGLTMHHYYTAIEKCNLPPKRTALSISFRTKGAQTDPVKPTSSEPTSVESTSIESTSIEPTSIEPTSVESTSIESTSDPTPPPEPTPVQGKKKTRPSFYCDACDITVNNKTAHLKSGSHKNKVNPKPSPKVNPKPKSESHGTKREPIKFDFEEEMAKILAPAREKIRH
jgi:hypothetical protein